MKLRKLEQLKRRISSRHEESVKMKGLTRLPTKLPPVECCREYVEPAEFAEHVYQDLYQAIERDFPFVPMAHPLDSEFMRHVSFAKPLVRVYEGNEEEWEAINRYVSQGRQCGGKGRRPPLLVTGPSGGGKSGVMANWFLNNKFDGFVLPHFVGASSDSTSHAFILHRALSELKRAHHLDGDVPADAEEMAGVLPLWLARVCEHTPVVVIIDGLDKLDDEAALDLRWLPHDVPAACSLLLSASTTTEASPRLLAGVAERGWRQVVEVDGLREDEKEKVIASPTLPY